MTIREILTYDKHEATLRKKSESVPAVNRRVKKLIQDLRETLAARTDGGGLAAPQIGIHSRVALAQLGQQNEDSAASKSLIVLVNPEIVDAGDDQLDFDGCLSFPGLYGETVRPHRLRVKGLDEFGKSFDRVFEGFDAVVVHHEIDHLDGVLFIDRVNSLDDLYRLRENQQGELVRVPLSASVR